MTDRWTIRAVTVFLGLIAVLCVAGGFALSFVGKDIPEAMVGIGSAALGSLATLLARTGSDSVTIDNNDTDPVPTVEVKKKGKS